MTDQVQENQAVERSAAKGTVTIVLDCARYTVPAVKLSVERIRTLPNPDIPADRDVFLELPGEDRKLLPGEEIQVHDGMVFYTAPCSINPGAGGGLPAQDEEFLRRRGYSWELAPAQGETRVIVKGFPVGAAGFTPGATDLMVRLPSGYPLAGLDMWYCDPAVRSGSGFPAAADTFEEHGGRRWQRFSRHLNGTWRPGVDGLRSFFRFIEEELQGRGANASHANAQ